MALLTQSEALEIINGFREKAVSRQALSKLNRNAWNFFKGSSVDTNKMSFWEYVTGARKPSRLVADSKKKQRQIDKAERAKLLYERNKGNEQRATPGHVNDTPPIQESRQHSIPVRPIAPAAHSPAFDNLSPKDLTVVLKNEQLKLIIAEKQKEVILQALVKQTLGAIDNAITMNFVYLGQRLSADLCSKMNTVGMESVVEGIINKEVEVGIQEVKKYCREVMGI